MSSAIWHEKMNYKMKGETKTGEKDTLKVLVELLSCFNDDNNS